MSEFTPTRSVAIRLREDRRTMREGAAFLDEKCALLAGAMLREWQRWRALAREFRAAQDAARRALGAALARHGSTGLHRLPAVASAQRVVIEPTALLGVPTVAARLEGGTGAAPPAVQPTPEAAAARAAFQALPDAAVTLAACSGNLARLHHEYRRTVRRVRALQDVLLPETERALAGVETALDELERDEAAFMRRASRHGAT